MIQIKKAHPKDYKVISKLNISSFITAHSTSGPKKDIDDYIFQNFSEQNVLKELKDVENHFYLIFYKNKIAGYSKVVFNLPSEKL